MDLQNKKIEENKDLKIYMLESQLFKQGQRIEELSKRVMLKRDECYQRLDSALSIIKELLTLPFASNSEVYADIGSILYRADKFIKDNT